ncbi:LOW QUALITY PROTEIN: organic cation transporter protein-like [Cydia pomonella]|uniref:LOW QUALITY PROTEIN: organic cation transporter protein-like n=1 Tax=Cydia pomonella TaxID=82600 RepID=UPI002ADE83C0|nr:LOW QUALITY PROTEIN: organic cation transporter protein-like [Cydia pomonella]
MTESVSVGESKLDFETVLNNAVGEFGKYQLISILLLAIPAACSGFMAGDYIFTAARLPHRCAVPLCDGLEPEYLPDWISNAIPETATGIDECNRYINITDNSNTTLGDVCPAIMFDRNRTESCDSFVFERTNTVVYDFNLQCQEWRRALAGTFNSIGGMVALIIAGYISDNLGRRMSIVFFGFNEALTGLVRAFSVNYAMYVAFQFLQTAIGGGIYSASYILATELVGPKYRVLTSATMSSAFAAGQMIVGLVASVVTEWRHLTLVLFCPVFLTVFYYWIVHESHRWLLSKNKQEQARATLNHVAGVNGRTILIAEMEFLLTAIPRKMEANKIDTKTPLLIRVVKSHVMLRRCCITPVWWITTTFIYYGLSINSVSLSGNMYLNYVATAAVEIPGYWTAVLVLDRVGRKVTLFTGYMLCAICCISFAFIPNNMYGLSLALYLTGKFSIAAVFTSLYLYTSELYPTRHRHSFLGYSSMMGRIGSIISPLTPPLMVYWSGIPSMLFGAMAVISAVLLLSQPETLGTKLPDTIEDAELLGSA